MKVRDAEVPQPRGKRWPRLQNVEKFEGRRRGKKKTKGTMLCFFLAAACLWAEKEMGSLDVDKKNGTHPADLTRFFEKNSNCESRERKKEIGRGAETKCTRKKW